MAEKISSSELERLIRRKVKEKGLAADVSDEQIIELKKKIRDAVNGRPATPDVQMDVNAGAPAPGEIPTPITHEVQADPESLEVAHKEGELSQKEQDLASQELELKQRESELEQKEKAEEYVPQLPAFINDIGPESIIVFDMNELSFGGESMSNAAFRLKANPNEKASPHQLWVAKGIKTLKVYMSQPVQIGIMEFNPFNGTTTFTHTGTQLPDAIVPSYDATADTEAIAKAENTGSLQAAIDSQFPKEPMQDAIEPKDDVTVHATDPDMGLGSAIDQIIREKIHSVMKSYFAGETGENGFPALK